MGLNISKKYTDANAGTLQSGDMVYYDITFKNESKKRLENIAYVDDLPEYLYFDNTEFISGPGEVGEFRAQRKSGVDSYEILLDGLYLDPGEEMTVRYELRTYPLSYGHIQVGLFESGEVGDDDFGDIILKESEQNCGREAKIFRSSAARSYVEAMTEPVCDQNAIEV